MSAVELFEGPLSTSHRTECPTLGGVPKALMAVLFAAVRSMPAAVRSKADLASASEALA